MSQGPNADTMARLDALMRQLNQVEASVGGRSKSKMSAAGIACIVVLVIVAVLIIGGGVCYSCRDSLAEYGFVLPAQLLGTSTKSAPAKSASAPVAAAAAPLAKSLASARTRAQLKQAVRAAPKRLATKAAAPRLRTALASASSKQTAATAPLLRPARRGGPAAASLMAATGPKLQQAAHQQQQQRLTAKKVSFAVNTGATNNRTLKLAGKSLSKSSSKPASTGLLGNARKALHTKDQILKGVRLSASQASTSARRTTQLASSGNVFSQSKRSVSQVDPHLGLGRLHAQDLAVKRMREKLKAGQTLTPPVGAGQSQAWVAARDQVLAELQAAGELPPSA